MGLEVNLTEKEANFLEINLPNYREYQKHILFLNGKRIILLIGEFDSYFICDRTIKRFESEAGIITLLDDGSRLLQDHLREAYVTCDSADCAIALGFYEPFSWQMNSTAQIASWAHGSKVYCYGWYQSPFYDDENWIGRSIMTPVAEQPDFIMVVEENETYTFYEEHDGRYVSAGMDEKTISILSLDELCPKSVREQILHLRAFYNKEDETILEIEEALAQVSPSFMQLRKQKG